MDMYSHEKTNKWSQGTRDSTEKKNRIRRKLKAEVWCGDDSSDVEQLDSQMWSDSSWRKEGNII